MPALRHQGDAGLAAQFDDGGDLPGVRRPRNGGGPARKQAAPVDPVGGTIGLVRQEAARSQLGFEPGEKVGRQAGRAHGLQRIPQAIRAWIRRVRTVPSIPLSSARMLARSAGAVSASTTT